MSPPTIQNYSIFQKVCSKLCFDVYEGRSELDQRRVLLKVLDPQFTKDETNVFNFLNGARLCRRLENEHVCRVLHFGREDGKYIIVSEPTGQRSLSLMMDEEFPIPLQQTRDLILALAQILREVHVQGVVHGLLNPSSIFMTSEGFKIDDLGYTWVVRHLLESISGEAAHLSYYMSPEVYFQTSLIDGRADIYSLGVILLQLLTEKSSFDCHPKMTFRNKELLGYLPAVKGAFAQNADLLEQILSKSLSKSPEGRYQNLKDFIEDVKRIENEAPKMGTTAYANGKQPHRTKH